MFDCPCAPFDAGIEVVPLISPVEEEVHLPSGHTTVDRGPHPDRETDRVTRTRRLRELEVVTSVPLLATDTKTELRGTSVAGSRPPLRSGSSVALSDYGPALS